MLLVIDVGNTKIAVGIFQGDRMRASWRIATDIDRMADEYAALLSNLLTHEGLAVHDVEEAILCSVVPPLVITFQELCQRYFKVSPLVVGAGIKTGMNIRMDNPREVGADRIAKIGRASCRERV